MVMVTCQIPLLCLPAFVQKFESDALGAGHSSQRGHLPPTANALMRRQHVEHLHCREQLAMSRSIEQSYVLRIAALMLGARECGVA
jgi:hypothetical protein